MATLLTLKTILIIVIAIAASTGASTIYFQLKASNLNNQLATVNDQLTKSNRQVSDLTNQTSRLQSSNLQLSNTNTHLSEQIQVIQTQLDNLTTQIARLTTKINALTSHPPTNLTLISTGSIYIAGYGAVQYIPFTSTPSQTQLNITFSGGPTILMLLNQTQYDSLNSCNCISYGNYTSSTWQSPQSASYHTIIKIPKADSWYLAFLQLPGSGYGFTVNETILLISKTVPLT